MLLEGYIGVLDLHMAKCILRMFILDFQALAYSTPFQFSQYLLATLAVDQYFEGQEGSEFFFVEAVSALWRDAKSCLQVVSF